MSLWQNCDHQKTSENTYRSKYGARCRICATARERERTQMKTAQRRGELAVQWLEFSTVRRMFQGLYPGRVA